MRCCLKNDIQELLLAKYSVFLASWKPCDSKERESNSVAYTYTPSSHSATGVMFGRRINLLTIDLASSRTELVGFCSCNTRPASMMCACSISKRKSSQYFMFLSGLGGTLVLYRVPFSLWTSFCTVDPK